MRTIKFIVGMCLLLCGICMLTINIHYLAFALFPINVMNLLTLGIIGDVLWIVAGIRCIKAFFIDIGGMYIVKSGVIGLIAFAVQIVDNLSFYRLMPEAILPRMLYLLMPILVIVCGIYWVGYCKTNGQKAKEKLPFAREIYDYIKQKLNNYERL